MNTTKLPLRERRYNKALAALERTRRRREEAIRTLVKCENLIPQLERKARRLGAPPRSKPTTQVESPVLPTIEPKIAADGTPDFLRGRKDRKNQRARERRAAAKAAPAPI